MIWRVLLVCSTMNACAVVPMQDQHATLHADGYTKSPPEPKTPIPPRPPKNIKRTVA